MNLNSWKWGISPVLFTSDFNTNFIRILSTQIMYPTAVRSKTTCDFILTKIGFSFEPAQCNVISSVCNILVYVHNILWIRVFELYFELQSSSFLREWWSFDLEILFNILFTMSLTYKLIMSSMIMTISYVTVLNSYLICFLMIWRMFKS